MTASLRTLLVSVLLAGTTSFALAGSLEVIRTKPVPMDHVARPPLPATATVLAHVTTTGTTKPPGAALDGRLGTSPALDDAGKRLGALVRLGICTGCR